MPFRPDLVLMKVVFFIAAMLLLCMGKVIRADDVIHVQNVASLESVKVVQVSKPQ